MSRVETDPFGTAEPNVKDLISRSIIGPTVHNFGPLRKKFFFNLIAHSRNFFFFFNLIRMTGESTGWCASAVY